MAKQTSKVFTDQLIAAANENDGHKYTELLYEAAKRLKVLQGVLSATAEGVEKLHVGKKRDLHAEVSRARARKGVV